MAFLIRKVVEILSLKKSIGFLWIHTSFININLHTAVYSTMVDLYPNIHSQHAAMDEQWMLESSLAGP
jgi:hypothetical protein